MTKKKVSALAFVGLVVALSAILGASSAFSTSTVSSATADGFDVLPDFALSPHPNECVPGKACTSHADCRPGGTCTGIPLRCFCRE